MLLRRGGFSEPAIVGNIDQQIRAEVRKLANLSGINRLVANVSAKLKSIRKSSDNAICSLTKSADFARYTRHHAMNQRKRLVLAERYEMHLVIHKNASTGSIHHHRAVVRRLHVRSRRQRLRFPFDRPRKKRPLPVDRNPRSESSELRVLPGKRRRRFRPDN